MPNKTLAVYWDACCFIGRIQREKDKIAELEELTELAEKEKLLIVTSTLTIVETLWGAGESEEKKKDRETVSRYFEHPWIVLRALDRRTAEQAAEIRCAHNIKAPDAIHLATALRWGVKFYHTYDDRLLKKNGLLGTPPLEIVKPRYPEDHPLFDNLQERAEERTEAETADSQEARLLRIPSAKPPASVNDQGGAMEVHSPPA